MPGQTSRSPRKYPRQNPCIGLVLTLPVLYLIAWFIFVARCSSRKWSVLQDYFRGTHGNATACQGHQTTWYEKNGLFSFTLDIVNAWRWLWNWTSSFVSCFCPYFWPWPCTKHTFFREDNHSNPSIKLYATNLRTRSKRKQKIMQGHGQFNIDCNNIVLAFESSKVS